MESGIMGFGMRQMTHRICVRGMKGSRGQIQQGALQQLIGPLKAQITLARGTVCNLGNDITEMVTRGMVLRGRADEYDTQDPAKAGRNAYGRCRVQQCLRTVPAASTLAD